MENKTSDDEVIPAITSIMAALKPLDTEGRLHALEFVTKRLGINLMAASHVPEHPTTQPSPTLRRYDAEAELSPRSPQPPAGQDIRSFAAAKAPRTVNEKVALIAYYLAHLAPQHERRDHIVADDINTYFIQADFELPTAPRMTLTHAKNAGYLNGLDRGRYKLNPVGHNLVVHKLPAAAGEPRRKLKRTSKARKKARK